MSEATINSATGATREQLLERVRASLNRARTPVLSEMLPPPAVPEELARLTRSDEDLMTLFEKRATAVGMKVQRVVADQVIAKVIDILKTVEARKLVVSVGSLPQGLALKDSLRRANMEIIDWQSQPGFACQYDTHAGITDVQAALVESGSLICTSGPGHSRGLSLVPPIHIAIVRRSDLLPDMLDYWRQFGPQVQGPQLPSSIVFITGPSKTADIEGVLVTGVHGPGQVFVLLVE